MGFGPCYHRPMELDEAITAVSLLLACWGLYLTRLQVFPKKAIAVAYFANS